MKTTITIMERGFITTILHDKEFGDDDDMKTATMMLMLMMMLMVIIFLCCCEVIDLKCKSPKVGNILKSSPRQRVVNPETTDDTPRNNG